MFCNIDYLHVQMGNCLILFYFYNRLKQQTLTRIHMNEIY